MCSSDLNFSSSGTTALSFKVMAESSITFVSASADKAFKDVIEVVSKLPRSPATEDIQLYKLSGGESKTGTIGKRHVLESEFSSLFVLTVLNLNSVRFSAPS